MTGAGGLALLPRSASVAYLESLDLLRERERLFSFSAPGEAFLGERERLFLGERERERVRERERDLDLRLSSLLESRLSLSS